MSGRRPTIGPRRICSQSRASLPQSIVAQLKAKLSPQQKAEIEERPTQDLVAFELYLQAKQIVDSYLIAEDVRAALLKALRIAATGDQTRRKICLRLLLCGARERSTLLFRSRSDARSHSFGRDGGQHRVEIASRLSGSAFRQRRFSLSMSTRLRCRVGRARNCASRFA